MNYRRKFEEAQFYFRYFQVSFDSHYGNFEHHLNNFLSSAQSVIWTLNNEAVPEIWTGR